VRSSAALSSVKVVVSGGFGVGKTTFIDTISEIESLDSEAPITEVAIRIDDTGLVPSKIASTVALDFGHLWDDLSRGAIGAIIIADTRRIEDSFSSIEYFERRSTPFLLAVNRFDGTTRFKLDEVRDAVGVDDDVPVVECDARERGSVKRALLTLLDRVLITHDDYLRVRQVAQ
jgi:uncharacterized protein